MLSKDPHTLDEVIKQAHVYANPSEENEDKSSHKNAHLYNSNMNKLNTHKKHKINSDTAEQGKKTMSTSWPLSKENFKQAKKKKPLFLVYG